MELIVSEHLRLRMGQRGYLDIAHLEWVVAHPIETIIQDDGRRKLYGRPPGEARFWKVVLEPDGRTVVTAYRDRDYHGPA